MKINQNDFNDFIQKRHNLDFINIFDKAKLNENTQKFQERYKARNEILKHLDSQI